MTAFVQGTFLPPPPLFLYLRSSFIWHTPVLQGLSLNYSLVLEKSAKNPQDSISEGREERVFLSSKAALNPLCLWIWRASIQVTRMWVVKENPHNLFSSCTPICFILFILKINLFLASVGLCGCTWVSSSCTEKGLLSGCVSQAAHCGGFSCCKQWAWGLSSSGKWLRCSSSYGTFPKWGSNLRPLHWQADS